MPANSSVLGIEYKINLDEPAPGERFVATGTVVRAGRTLSVVESEVRAEADGKSNAVARLLATMMCSTKAEAGHGA
jgi:acyl-coenzyme A thioesterase PaaI-like protein